MLGIIVTMLYSEANLRYRELNDALERTQGQLRDAGVSNAAL